ncbi:dynein light chain binding protein [Aureococcus anophagefferens]|nr:dynein light chain binding protein [Aureococcus anophagefferens]
MAGDEKKGEEEGDPRIAYVLRQIATSFRSITPENYEKFRKDPVAQELIEAFVHAYEGGPSALYVVENRGGLRLSAAPPAARSDKEKGKDDAGFLYILKLGAAATALDASAYESQLVIGECSVGVLEHAEQVAMTVFSPLLAAVKNDWSELVVREVDESLSAFVANVQIMQGHVKGMTSLPLPPDWAVQSQKGMPAGASRATIAGASPEGSVVEAKDAIHALESSIITWTKQIKAVLKQDPETALVTEGRPHPGPVAELDFWTAKARNLNSIFDQLQSTRVRRVLRCLDRAQSTYNAPFAKLCKELFHARTEANDNVKYLEPLRPWVEQLETSAEFSSLPELFAPIVHIILLVWKGSGHYNTPTRLVVLLREICNALVHQATAFLSGDRIFELIDSEDARDAVTMLRETLRVLAEFKQVYLAYKDKANAECPLNPWRVQNNAVFVRLDAFWERSHDLLELTCTTMQFSNLAKIEVGGTKGKILTTSVLQIHVDFTAAVSAVRKHGHERLLEVEAKEFDDAFYEFRVAVKELERRLASVLTQGFDDAPTISGRFKLLDSFDALVQRPVIADELEKKYVELVVDYGEDVRQMQNLFMQLRESPPIAHNLPPIAGALTWCRGLLQRVQLPMEKLKRLERKVMEREEARDVVKDYTAFLGQLSDYERSQIEAWGGSVERSSQAKLKNPLLRLEAPPDGTPGPGLLYVNFDPLLVRLLREVKYFLLLGFTAPGSALEIYRHSEVFRRHMGNLDLIVNVYNWMQTSLLPVERPLLKNQLDKIDKLLAQGIGKTGGGDRRASQAVVKKALNWKSSNIDLYINEAMSEVNEMKGTMTVMKANLHRVEELMDGWSSQPLLKRSGKAATATVADFEQLQKVTLTQRYGHIREGGGEIHKLLRDTNRKLKVSQGLPDWKAYVDFVNNIVVGGLKRVVVVSCVVLENQLDPVYLAKHNPGPMLEIELDLVDQGVRYLPEIGFNEAGRREADQRGLRNIFRNWMDNFSSVACIFKRLDTGEGHYLRELQDDLEVTWYLATIEGRLNHTEAKVERLRQHFLRYEYLWTTDLQVMFAEFLETAIVEVEAKKEAVEGEEDDDDTGVAAVDEGDRLNLDLFEEKIKLYLEVQAEIAELKPLHEIDFLRIIAQPIKQALGTWVTKWMYMFTNYLQSRIMEKLNELHAFMSEIDRGLDQVVEEGDKATLMSVMTHIRDVRKRMPTMDDTFVPLREMVLLLKTHGITLDLGKVGADDALDFLERAPLQWDNVVNKTFRVKESIQPLQNAMVDTIKRDIADYVERAMSAYKVMDATQKELMVMETEAESFANLQELFELNKIRAPQLAEMRMELGFLKQVWDTVAVVESLFSSWKQTLWLDIQTDDLLDETKRLLNQVKRLPRRLRDWPCYLQLLASCTNMSTVLPLVAELHSPAMRDRHWKAVASVTSRPLDKGPTFSLSDLLALELHRHVDGIMEVVETANKENKVEAKLGAIERSWSEANFEMARHRDTEVMIIVSPDDLLETLDEHHIQLQSMAAMGRAVDFFRAELTAWQGTLGNIEVVMKVLLSVQRSWSSLEAIFLASHDIRAQLPDDTKRFEGIDLEFKELMRDIAARKGVVACCSAEGREISLNTMNKELEICQKALSEYLDMKKNIFPRCFFVSNMALLDILSNSNNPTKIMPHIGAVFDGIDHLVFVETAKVEEEDEVELEDSLSLGSGKKAATPTLANAMKSKDGETVPFEAEPFAMQGAVEQWLNDLTTFMRDTLRGSLDNSLTDASNWDTERPREEWVANYAAQIALVTSQIVWTEETETALDDLENGTDDAVKKYLEVCKSRLENLISQDFLWSSQLRFYWVAEEREVEIRICDFRSVYSFEYVGNCGRLVITPLTDRCYVTLTTALRLFLGGAPAGPAGTGKTETTKDLARGLGLPCYVFNCSDQMNYQTMADIFRGLSQAGAWGCFDEFNRIPIEVLSVVATQVKTVLDAAVRLSDPARREAPSALPAGTPPVKVGEFEFFGEKISLIPCCGFFITMNPGYAGRTELPENLKASFRSCAMIRPDLRPICENMLMAEGFIKARPLAAKFVTLYKLSSELLSKQAHYDWGLRAVKSVLRVAGKLKRAEPEVNEEAILMRALRDFNTPKIPAIDIPIFLRLISDLFPGLDLPTKVNEDLQALASRVCAKEGLQGEDIFISKVVQFQELLDVRHSVMILGPAGAGKTTIYKTLAGCHNVDKPKAVCVYEAINPKAVTSDELYGYMTLSKDWKDGCLSIVMRNMCKEWSPYAAHQTYKWVVLDGDIDAVWIESMNTVMDDNKVLTLVSNERIPLTESMRMVFEIHSLKNATPATLATMPGLFDKYVPQMIDLLKERKVETLTPVMTISRVTSLCYLLEGLLAQVPDAAKDQERIERLFLYASVWAFGGVAAADKTYYVDPSTGELAEWAEKVPTYEPVGVVQFSSIVVPTADLVSLTTLTKALVERRRPVMFVGSAGTGKTILVREFLRNLPDDSLSATINMNYYTDAQALQRQLEQPIEKRSGKSYGPPAGKSLIYFVDDLNMPFVEEYGTQTPIALMRMHADYNSWYDRTDLGLRKMILDCQYICAMNHKAGSFSVNPRLQRHFTAFGCQSSSEVDLAMIYQSILDNHVGADFPPAAAHRQASVYLPVKSLESLRKTLNDQLKEYNESNPIMNLVLFDQAMMHVVRIARIVGFPPGQRIVDERFLVYINDLLASGVIPDLFTRDEYDAIFGQLRNAAKAAGIPDTSDSMMEFFIDRVCHNLHVVLCFSPIGDLFRVRSRKFPGLINCTSIDWFHPWPKDALVSVAQYFLESVDLGTPEVSDNIAHHVAEVHSSVGTVSQMYFESEKRYNYVTPTSFLELINFYKSLLATRREEMTAMITRLDTGLTTLKTTNEDVSRLQADLKVKMLEVDEKKVACDVFLEKMGRQRGEAEEAQAEADKERAKADLAAQDARNIEERAAGDLALAKPALDAALDAVNCLDKASMTELKSFSKPPAGVDKVTAVLLILIKNEKKNFTWDNAKKMMAKVDAFKEQLEAFRGEDIDPDIVRRCEPYLADPNFSYEKMKTKSAAAANLCNWAVNIITFNQVYKKVKPLMDQLEQAQETKRAAEKDLAVVEEKLAVIDAALNKLQAQFLSATQEKAAVEKYDRWGLEIDHLRSVEGTLVGDVLLSAAFVSYVGAFGSKFRSMLTKDYWIADLASREIPLTEGIEPMRLLTTEAKTAEWMNEGLPADRISIENGAIITNCNRWPLIIDPQLQGLKWIRAHEEARLSRGKKKPPAEDAAGDGAEAPAEGDDAAPAAAARGRGRTLFIRMGGEDLEYDPDFRLYLQTRLANPHYKPEIAAQCTLINFIGLETTKATAAEINQAVIKGKQTEEGINEAREIYRPVAAEASVLYFMLLKLNRIEYSYQYSLASFTTFFHNGMERGGMSDDPKKTRRRAPLERPVDDLPGLAQTSEDGEQGSGPWAKISALAGYTPEGLAFLLRGPRSGGEDPPAPWVTEAAWGMVQALSSLTGFEKLPSDLEDSAPRFLEWFNAVTPETEKLPLDWRDLDRRPFQKLLVVRCLRPDRLTSALAHFVRNTLPSGANYTDLDADSNSFGVLEQAFDDASPSVPIYFILSPGANVVADVDKLAKRDGMERDVTYHNISLGQGQDIIAREKLETAHRLGHWVILNNVHLMPRWLRDVEKLLDEFQEHGSHAAFRVFLSSDPTKTIPIGILDRSIKLTSDPPSGLKANIKQAFCTFTREDYEELEPRTRGHLGTNMHYPFSVGDLTSSASVLRNYMENAPTKVPWDDLRYLFGEIMYGGHIVNDFDRLVCAEYLHFFMRDDMLDEMDMYPYPDVKLDYFHAPQTSISHDKVLEHIDAQLEGDSPLAFGFHPNAEIGFRTDQSEQLCLAIIDLSPSASGGGEEGSSEQNVAEAMLQDILEQHRDATFDVENVLSLLDEPGPYHTVFLQECELMNALVLKMISSLEDLDLGFRGELTMSESMEALQEALFLDRVPGEWAKVAYPSIRFLTPWLANLQVRLGQLRDWCAAPTDIPVVTWLSGLFNPESFLTAVMQTTAQAQNLELDKLSVATEVTKKLDPSEFSTPSRDGAYISGLALEGARAGR